MSPEQIAQLLRMVADELSEESPRVLGRDEPGAGPILYPDMSIRDRGCTRPRYFDPCFSGCPEANEWRVRRCNMRYCDRPIPEHKATALRQKAASLIVTDSDARKAEAEAGWPRPRSGKPRRTRQLELLVGFGSEVQLTLAQQW